MSTQQKPIITIIGAGLAGCFMAILLAKRGYTISIYERYSKEDVLAFSSKRSFNLAFYKYAVDVLKDNGIWEKVVPYLTALEGSITHVGTSASMQPVFTQYESDMPYYSIHRSVLLQVLLEYAENLSSVTIHYETSFVSAHRDKKEIIVEHTKTGEQKTIACEIVIGADGVNSKVRAALQQDQKASCIQEYADWNYKQLFISKQLGEKIGLRKNVMHIWTRKNAILAALPNLDSSITGILILPDNKKYGFSSLVDTKSIDTFMHTHFPTLLLAKDTFEDVILNNPESRLVTIYTHPWYYKDFMVIIGDAAHGFLPFLGQGTSAAFGDCLEIVGLIDEYGNNWEKIFSICQARRKKHMDTLADLSKDSFKRLRRYKRADYTAIYDKGESILARVLPWVFPQPLFIKIAKNPSYAADYVNRHATAKKIGIFLGLPLLTALLTLIVSIKDHKKT